MKVLVTGGSGFVGSHVVEALVEAKHEPIVFDLRPPTGGLCIVGDLSRLEEVTEAIDAVDAVCHLGGVGDVYLAYDNPPLAALYNVVGTANIVEAAAGKRLHKVVYASTWEVYGHAEYQPLDEAHPCNPDHPYSITKLAGERIAMAYDRLRGVRAVSLRLGTAYGRRMRPNAVFSRFISQALARQPISIQGTGNQSRQFTHARDIARAFVAAVETDVHGEVLNIVAQEDVSVRQLAEQVAAALPTELVFAEARIGDVMPGLVSSAKAELVLGWSPQVSFNEGLLDIIESYTEVAASSPVGANA